MLIAQPTGAVNRTERKHKSEKHFGFSKLMNNNLKLDFNDFRNAQKITRTEFSD